MALSLCLSEDGLFAIAKKFQDSFVWKIATQLTSYSQLNENATGLENLRFRITLSK